MFTKMLKLTSKNQTLKYHGCHDNDGSKFKLFRDQLYKIVPHVNYSVKINELQIAMHYICHLTNFGT